MNIEDIDIHDILLQQDPFVMIDCLTHFDEKVTTADFTIREDNLFVDNGRMKACALTEVIAQVCSARLGYYNKYILKRGIQLGFIGAIHKLKIADTPKVGETLHTRIEVLQDIMGILLVDAEVRTDDRLIATGQMKMAIANEDNM